MRRDDLKEISESRILASSAITFGGLVRNFKFRGCCIQHRTAFCFSSAAVGVALTSSVFLLPVVAGLADDARGRRDAEVEQDTVLVIAQQRGFAIGEQEEIVPATGGPQTPA